MKAANAGPVYRIFLTSIMFDDTVAMTANLGETPILAVTRGLLEEAEMIQYIETTVTVNGLPCPPLFNTL